MKNIVNYRLQPCTRITFLSFYFVENLSEDLLEAHDQEVVKVKAYYNENEAMFQKLHQRQNMFKLYLELEVRKKGSWGYTL